ncbi:MAG TPA: phycobiliprotein lyase, partial [Cyanothece sp. UBA12306]|nr:phycobiliprotein lyase [Cyanothece sp. UBA12306]
MTSVQIAQLSQETLVKEFFEKSEGNWHSQRRYYTLTPDVATKEMTSIITVEFLEQGCPQLIKLAKAHSLENETALVCGSYVGWESKSIENNRKISKGSTIFGVLGNILYRDRGFATPKPVKAAYSMTNPQGVIRWK